MGQGGTGWDRVEAGAVTHRVAGLGCKSTMIGTRWVNSCPGRMYTGIENTTLILHVGAHSGQGGFLGL